MGNKYPKGRWKSFAYYIGEYKKGSGEFEEGAIKDKVNVNSEFAARPTYTPYVLYSDINIKESRENKINESYHPHGFASPLYGSAAGKPFGASWANLSECGGEHDVGSDRPTRWICGPCPYGGFSRVGGNPDQVLPGADNPNLTLEDKVSIWWKYHIAGNNMDGLPPTHPWNFPESWEEWDDGPPQILTIHIPQGGMDDFFRHFGWIPIAGAIDIQMKRGGQLGPKHETSMFKKDAYQKSIIDPDDYPTTIPVDPNDPSSDEVNMQDEMFWDANSESAGQGIGSANGKDISGLPRLGIKRNGVNLVHGDGRFGTATGHDWWEFSPFTSGRLSCQDPFNKQKNVTGDTASGNGCGGNEYDDIDDDDDKNNNDDENFENDDIFGPGAGQGSWDSVNLYQPHFASWIAATDARIQFKQVREIVTNPISVYQVPGQTNEVAAEQNEDWLKALDHQWDDNAGSIFNAWCSDVVYIGEINSQCSLRPDGQGEHSVPGSTIIIKPLSPAGTVPDNVVIKSNCPGVNQITQDSIDHFVNVCLGTELGGSPIVRRWESDVSIKVHFMDSAGEELPENPRDMRTVQNVIGDLNGLIDTINIRRVSSQGNVDLYFTTESRFETETGLDVPANSEGFFNYFINNENEIINAKIWINLDTSRYDDNFRRHLIREEITQALGFGNDVVTYPDGTEAESSVFYQYAWQLDENAATSYSTLDIQIINILYSDMVDVADTEAEVREKLSHFISDSPNPGADCGCDPSPSCCEMGSELDVGPSLKRPTPFWVKAFEDNKCDADCRTYPEAVTPQIRSAESCMPPSPSPKNYLCGSFAGSPNLANVNHCKFINEFPWFAHNLLPENEQDRGNENRPRINKNSSVDACGDRKTKEGPCYTCAPPAKEWPEYNYPGGGNGGPNKISQAIAGMKTDHRCPGCIGFYAGEHTGGYDWKYCGAPGDEDKPGRYSRYAGFENGDWVTAWAYRGYWWPHTLNSRCDYGSTSTLAMEMRCFNSKFRDHIENEDPAAQTPKTCCFSFCDKYVINNDDGTYRFNLIKPEDSDPDSPYLQEFFKPCPQPVLPDHGETIFLKQQKIRKCDLENFVMCRWKFSKKEAEEGWWKVDKYDPDQITAEEFNDFINSQTEEELSELEEEISASSSGVPDGIPGFPWIKLLRGCYVRREDYFKHIRKAEDPCLTLGDRIPGCPGPAYIKIPCPQPYGNAAWPTNATDGTRLDVFKLSKRPSPSFFTSTDDTGETGIGDDDDNAANSHQENYIAYPLQVNANNQQTRPTPQEIADIIKQHMIDSGVGTCGSKIIQKCQHTASKTCLTKAKGPGGGLVGGAFIDGGQGRVLT